MRNPIKDFRKMLTSGDNDKISSKRLITFLAFIMVSIAFFGNMFWGLEVDENMFDGIIQIVWAGLGVVVGEHLLKRRNGMYDPDPDVGIEEPEEVGDDSDPEEELGDN